MNINYFNDQYKKYITCIAKTLKKWAFYATDDKLKNVVKNYRYRHKQTQIDPSRQPVVVKIVVKWSKNCGQKKANLIIIFYKEGEESN